MTNAQQLAYVVLALFICAGLVVAVIVITAIAMLSHISRVMEHFTRHADDHFKDVLQRLEWIKTKLQGPSA
jgi:hypothetical protein